MIMSKQMMTLRVLIVPRRLPSLCLLVALFVLYPSSLNHYNNANDANNNNKKKNENSIIWAFTTNTGIIGAANIHKYSNYNNNSNNHRHKSQSYNTVSTSFTATQRSHHRRHAFFSKKHQLLLSTNHNHQNKHNHDHNRNPNHLHCRNNRNNSNNYNKNSQLFSTAAEDTDTSIATTTSITSTSNTATDNNEIKNTLQPQQYDYPSHKFKSKLLASDDQFIKSTLDNRQYRSILLPNNLQVLLVSDTKTDVEAASVHVKAGHFDDPIHRPGLAHFHEHMIFLGNEKYPGENDFDKFVSKNGGTTNAYTDMEDTNYYFSVAPLDHDNDSDDIDDADDDNDEIDIEYEMVVGEDNHDVNDNDTTDTDAIDTDITDKDNTENKISLALSGALDRFAQFFISPSFNSDSVERELRAIDSEYLNSMSSDAWRNYQLLKFSSNQSHPFAKFGCGNYNTLTNGGNITGVDAVSSGGSNPRDDLIAFWENKYCAENMKLCVVGRASLNELQQAVETSFADVRSKSTLDVDMVVNDSTVPTHSNDSSNAKSDNIFVTENSKYGFSAFGPDQLGILREYIPVVETRSIKLLFAVPPSDDPMIKEFRPDRVLSHLIGHESPGSLHALLSEEGMIEDLSSGSGVNTADFSLFSLTIVLTPKGMANRDYVLDRVWKWINLIKEAVYENKELMEKYHDELRLISETHFRFRENGDPTDFCSNAAEQLFDYEPSKVLAGSALPGPYNDKVVKAFLERLNPDNAIVNIQGPELEEENEEKSQECSAASVPWLVEKWYRAKYRDVKISDSLKAKWTQVDEADARLHLPALNEFLPSDFSLRSEDSDAVASFDPAIDYSKEMPRLLVDRPGLQMWHKLDRTFQVPRTSIRMLIITPNAYRSPRSMTLSRLYVKVLEDDLNSYIYDASLAGCRAKVTSLPSGYSISLSGYSEKLPHLLDVVTGRMLSIIEEMKQGSTASPGLAMKFDTATKNLLKDTKNYKYDSPYETASYISRMLLESNVWHVNNYIAEMEGEYAEKQPLTIEECGKVAEECLTGRLSAMFLIMGNVNEDGAKDIVNLIDNNFLSKARPLEHEEIPRLRSLRMPTMKEAEKIFGAEVSSRSIPIIIEEVAHSESEENHAIELILQAGCEHELGFEGIALIEFITQMAYNSAYNQLRTKEQLGYIVSAFSRKTAGATVGFSIVVQSSTTLPSELEKRCEAWLVSFREELESMSAEELAQEAAAVVAQLMERNMRFGDEVAAAWGSIVSTSVLGSLYNVPPFDRHRKLAEELNVEGMNNNFNLSSKGTAEELKVKVLSLWDKYFAITSPERRVISARVYGNNAREEYEKNIGKPGFISSYDEVRQLKQFLQQYPTAPYWIKRVE